MIGFLKKLLVFVLVLLALLYTALWWVYQPKVDGVVKLEDAFGRAEIHREANGIAHVFANSKLMGYYAQGFTHAQERLWQMEKQRRLIQGRLAELFGPDVVSFDKFFRALGMHENAKETVKALDSASLEVVEAYARGVNAFAKRVKFMDSESLQHLFPPEFYVAGIKEFEPWKPEDTIGLLKYLNFHLSWNWNQDLQKDIFSKYHPDLQEFLEDLFPTRIENLLNPTTILSVEDLKKTGIFSDETLGE